MSDKSSEISEMHDVAEASRLLQERWPMTLGSVKERIRAAAQALRWSHTRTRDLWYEQARRVDAHEMRRLKSAKEQIAERRANAARDELDRALALVAAHLAAEVAQGDRDAAHALRKIASAMDLAGGISAIG